MHLSVLPDFALGAEAIDAQILAAKKIMNEVLDRYAGSISAEHGIGRLKKADFEARLPATQRALLTAIKRAIDPALTMNPGCQFDLTTGSEA